MHKGTPIIYSHNLYIFHDITKADRMILYHPYSNELIRRGYGRYDQPTFINGDEFNPKGIVSFDWRMIVPRNLQIDKDWGTKTLHHADRRSRLINFIDMKPDEWPVIDWDDPKTYEHLVPHKCYLRGHDDNEAYSYDGRYNVDIDGATIQISRFVEPRTYNTGHIESGMFPYDPSATVHPWEATVVPMVERAVAKYEKYCEDHFGVASSGAGGKKPMDFAHMTPAEKESISKEFVEKVGAGGNHMSLINKMAQKRCTSSKAWRRTQGQNMRAAVLLALVDAGTVKVVAL